MKYAVPVITGLAATFAAGFFSFLPVYLIVDAFIEFRKGFSLRDLVVLATIILWIFTSTAVGGFVCSLFSENKEDFSIFMLIIISLSAIYFFTGGEIIKEKLPVIIPAALLYIGGHILGGYLGIKHKREKLSH